MILMEYIRLATIWLKMPSGPLHLKNFLFCGNHDAAEQTAIIYSMMQCCKVCDANPRKWIEYVFNCYMTTITITTKSC